jgi:hypothetical protein
LGLPSDAQTAKGQSKGTPYNKTAQIKKNCFLKCIANTINRFWVERRTFPRSERVVGKPEAIVDGSHYPPILNVIYGYTGLGYAIKTVLRGR